VHIPGLEGVIHRTPKLAYDKISFNLGCLPALSLLVVTQPRDRLVSLSDLSNLMMVIQFNEAFKALKMVPDEEV